MASPSIFSSQLNATSPEMKRSIRFTHAWRSSKEVALSSDIIGWRWRASAKRTDTPAPTFCVGDSGRHQVRVLLFERLQLPDQGVVVGVADLGVVELVVPAVVVLDLRAQLLDSFGWCLCHRHRVRGYRPGVTI